MTFPVVRLAPECWDQAFAAETLARLGGVEVGSFDDADGGAAVIIPARYYTDRVDWLNGQLTRLDWAVVFLLSDEEATFPWRKLDHRNMRLWVQEPRPGVHDGHDRCWPLGPPPDTAETLRGLREVAASRPDDWFFSGQVNHLRRRRCLQALAGLPGGQARRTPGFTQGFARGDYLRRLASAKVAPCPPGPATADTFRVWEALEAGCVPVADSRCEAYGAGYWPMLFDGYPFPLIDRWADFPAQLAALLADWPACANRAQAWWLRWRRDLRCRVADDITAVGGEVAVGPDVTVLVPSSSIPSHPSTAMIETTVGTVRHHLPDAEIILMCDGVRAEQEHRRADYEEYVRRVLWLARYEWDDVTPLVFDRHEHQANMARQALNLVRTPLVAFVEHDTPVVIDEPIDWEALRRPLLADQLDVVRLHHEACIHPEHEYLMFDRQPVDVAGCPVIRTIQFSARPHLARTDWYRQVIGEHFPPSGRTFIEDVLHSVCQCEPWARNRLAVYAPGKNMKRSWNLDGRESDPKADCVFR